MAQRRTRTTGRQRRGGCLYRLLVMLMAVVAVVGAMAAFGAVQDARALSTYPAPGRMVSVNGHSLHLTCTGQGSPTVVLEAGAGGSVLDWQEVQPEVAQFTRVCSYDRAGFGWSEVGPAPRDANRLVNELAVMLHRSGEQPPYVLVGSSFGGLLAQVYAYRYPESTAGLVLVDSVHPDSTERLPPEIARAQATTTAVLWPIEQAKRFGLFDLAAALGVVQPPASLDALPPDVREQVLVVGYRLPYWRAFRAEAAAQPASLETGRAARPLPDVPLIVIARGQPGELGPGVPAGVSDAAETAWRTLQEELAALTPGGELIVAEESGHLIPVEQPQIVIDAIRQIVEQVGGAG